MIRPTAVAVKVLEKHVLEIEFNNGEHRIFDAAPLIKGSFYGELADPVYFSKVSIGGLSVEWPNGQDICPDDLYYNSRTVQASSMNR